MSGVVSARETDSGAEKEDPVAAPKRSKRRARLFPALAFDEALYLANAIQKHGAGQPIRRTTLFTALERSPDSGPTRKLITASVQYGLTTGGYSAEMLALTDKGRIASDVSSPPDAQLRSRIELAIDGVAPFKAIYDRYAGSRLPSVEVLRDAAAQAGVPEDQVAECVETFLANARGVGLVRTIGGSERLLERADALDSVPQLNRSEGLPPAVLPMEPSIAAAPVQAPGHGSLLHASSTDGPELDNTCFIISPIGGDGSEERLHADLVLSSLIEPALQDLGLVAVRADKISKPGLITGQVIDHITRAPMVIADLSFGNPNVYYELALRHATRRPIVQLIRSSDPLPFDVGQFRTVVIDMTSIFTLVPALDLHRQEIARQCRAALDEGKMAESPLSQFYPSFWEYVPGTRAR